VDARLSIVVPALNEAAGIERCLRGLASLRARGHEVVVADGGSTDGTAALAAPLHDPMTEAVLLDAGEGARLFETHERRPLGHVALGSDPLAALVFSPWPEPVDTVMVNGRLVVEGGALVGVDVPALVERAESASAALLDAALRMTGQDYRRKEGVRS